MADKSGTQYLILAHRNFMADLFKFELYRLGIHLGNGVCNLIAYFECFILCLARKVHKERICVTVSDNCTPVRPTLNSVLGLAILVSDMLSMADWSAYPLKRFPTSLHDSIGNLYTRHSSRKCG